MQMMKAAFARVVPDMVQCWQALTDEERAMELQAVGLVGEKADDEDQEVERG